MFSTCEQRAANSEKLLLTFGFNRQERKATQRNAERKQLIHCLPLRLFAFSSRTLRLPLPKNKMKINNFVFHLRAARSERRTASLKKICFPIVCTHKLAACSFPLSFLPVRHPHRHLRMPPVSPGIIRNQPHGNHLFFFLRHFFIQGSRPVAVVNAFQLPFQGHGLAVPDF